MGYFDYFKRILAPLESYDLESGVGADEIRVIGSQLDDVFLELDILYREAMMASAESYGIAMMEEIFPYRPSYTTVEEARRAIMALSRIRNGCFTLPLLNDTLSGCGIPATINETYHPMKVQVRFPENRGIPSDFESLKVKIETIVPCHLDIEYVFRFALWREIMYGIKYWREIEDSQMTWDDMEKFDPKVGLEV